MNSKYTGQLSCILAGLLVVYPMISEACRAKHVGHDCLVDVSCDVDSELNWYRFKDVSNYVIMCNYSNNVQFKLTYNFHHYEIYHTNYILPSIESVSGSKIIEINISPSNIKNIPVFYEMANIKTINFSDNSLTEAKLYNERPLISLQVLDYSHNNISSVSKGEKSYAFVGLTLLNVSHNELEAVPAEIFQYLTKLQSLDLSFNNIESLNIKSFTGLSQLQKLCLTSNRISDCAFSLQRLDELEELYLDRNEIKYLRTGEFEHLKKLRILILKSNLITYIDNNVFKNMNLLETVDLNSNHLSKINKNSFEGVENLRSVDLSFNKIEVLYGNVFKGNNISAFSIEGNKINGSIGKGVFEGVFRVTELDLSNQFITEIEDNAFFMLKELTSLNISHNHIQNISKFSFKTLRKLLYLDLSDNLIVDIDFDKIELLCLKSLNLRNNFIQQLNPGVFLGLSDLQELYLSNNNISSMAQNIFQALQQLVTIELSHNPLKGDIEANSFNGLESLEYLDLSYTLFNGIKNGAFLNKQSLKYLNVSHSNLTELEYNIFGNDTAIEIMDLSYNKLNKFVNICNTLMNLRELYLAKNFITKITKEDFDSPNKVSTLTLSQNHIEEIELHSFDKLSELKNLDLTLNPKLMFKGTLIQNNRMLETLYLSGTGNQITFTDTNSVPLLELVLSSSNISDLRFLEHSQLKSLIELDLSQNIVKVIEINVFYNLTNLRSLDLSFNQIISIRPGSFKGNADLNTLNISHNQINTITYGTFRGMDHVITIDLSFNYLKTLSSEQFLEIPNLKSLIVDANKLEKIEMDSLPALEVLSLGANLIKCKDLSRIISLSHLSSSLTITTMRKDFHSANVNGVTCNHESDADIADLSDIIENNGNTSAIVALLSDIRNMMHAMNNSHVRTNVNSSDIDNKLRFSNILLDKINNTTMSTQNHLQDFNKINDLPESMSNVTKILSRIFELLTVTAQSLVKTRADNNNTFSFNSTTHMDSLRNDFKLKELFLNNKVVDLEEKMQAMVSRLEEKIKIINETGGVKKENYIDENYKPGVENGHTTFTDVCVVFIFVVIVAVILYKFYEFVVPKLTRRSQRTASTRGMTESIENSNF